MYTFDILENKAKLYLVPQKDVASVTVLVMYPVGSRYEKEKIAGVSHFIEHMMFKGTKRRPSTLFLTREIDRLGAMYNAFTSKEYTGYYIKTAAKYLPISLDILSDMLHNSLFAEKEMIKEKNVIVEELRMYKDNPLLYIETLFEDLLYAGCPLGRDIGGFEKTVLGLPRADVLRYHKNFYAPENTYIAVAGAVDESTKKLVEKYFVQGVSVKEIGDRKYSAARFGPSEKKKRLKVEKKKTDQVQLMLGFPGFDYNSPHNPTVAVLDTILGGTMSSRLFIEIREKRGLAYMVRSGEENFYDTGYLSVRIGLEAKNINQAIDVTQNEIEKVIVRGVTAKELQDAKTHLRGALALSLEDSSAQASWYLRQAMFMKEIKTPEERLKEIDAVTNERIKLSAKKVFDFQQMRVAVIGDVEKEKINF